MNNKANQELCKVADRRRGVRRLAALLCWGALVALALRLLVLEPQHDAPSASPAPRPVVDVQPPRPKPDSRFISADDMCTDHEHDLHSLPLIYKQKHKENISTLYKNNNCTSFPSIYDIDFQNIYWQILYSSQGVFHFFGAYMDVRNGSDKGPAVRVLAVHDRINPTLATHCQLWFEGLEPVVVPNLQYKYVWEKLWGNYRDNVLQPYLMTCMLPKQVWHLIPTSVSIVEKPCDRATNNLRVHYDRPDPTVGRKEFAVCVKGLDFLHEDVSVRLIEWIELIKIMGADKIFVYNLRLHQNVTKVLDYYKNQGTVMVTPITLPGGQPNLPGLQHMYLKKKSTHKRQMELIPYNDCLYRHMYEYRWLVLLDIDEVIIPLEDPDWSSLMKRIVPQNTTFSSYYVSNVYFLESLFHGHSCEDSIPWYMHMLQQVYRARKFSNPGMFVKAFHETERVLALHNHFPLACLGGWCSSYPIDTWHARLQHYRADCVSALSKTCKELRAVPVRDTTLWRWRDPLVARAKAVLQTLGFLRTQRSSS